MTAFSNHPIIRSSDHRVSTLVLTHFRNHPSLTLSPQGQSVVITGANGTGKTNILEALSLFSPGKGLRGAKLAQLRHCHPRAGGDPDLDSCLRGNDENNRGWAVSLHLGNTQLGTGQHPNGGEKRLLRCNGENLAAQSDLTHYLTLLWQTPQMDGLFTQGASEQRRFFDRLVYSFDAEHAARVARYEYYMRERNKLLALGGDAVWLSTIERKMAEASVAIAAARLDTLHHLQAAMAQLHPAFPQAQLQLEGFAENALAAGDAALEVEEKLATQLAAFRREDALTGRSSLGAHRMELHATHNEKQMPAALCSTGEQKALMLSLLLAQSYALHQRQGRLPILLLDEVVAHLDLRRRTALFAALTELKVQSWMTGTDESLFEGFAAERIALKT